MAIFNEWASFWEKWYYLTFCSFISCTYSLIFWFRKVFEGVENYVWSCFEKFGPLFFFSKFIITCQKASLVHIQIVRKGNFGPDFSSNAFWHVIINFEKKKVDQTCIFVATSHVILDSFKHFSGPKYKIIRSKIHASSVQQIRTENINIS